MLIIAVLGIIILFAYRAWLGGLIYILGAALSIADLRKQYENDDKISVGDFIKKCLLGKNIGNKIMMVIAILLPIVVVVATFRWIVVDTIREVDAWF